MSFGSFRPPPPDADQAPSAAKATIFVSDPSAEAERIAQALRANAYAVVDVPMSLLVARVAVQRPHVILVDADAEGASDTIARMREIPDADTIDVLFIGRTAAGFEWDKDPVFAAGAFFTRPVDVAALVQKVDALSEKVREKADRENLSGTRPLSVPPLRTESIPPPPLRPRSVRPPPVLPGDDWEPSVEAAAKRSSAPPPPRRSSIPPPALASVPPPAPSSRPSVGPRPSQPPPPSNRTSAAVLPPPSIRAEVERQSQPPPPTSLASLASLASAHLQGGPGTGLGPASKAPRRAISVQGTLSGELAQLLSQAEERAGAEYVAPESSPPSPEEEIEAVLPEEILAALDEPLEESDEEELGGDGPEQAPVQRTTSSGGGKQTTGTGVRRPTTHDGTGVGTHVVPGTAAEGTVAADPRTHGGPTSTGLTMGHLAMPPAPAPAAAPMPASIEPPPAPSSLREPLADPASRPFSAPPATTHDPRSMNKLLGLALAEGGTSSYDSRPPTRATAEPTPLPPALSANETRAVPMGRTVPPVAEPIPSVLGPNDAPLALARAIASRLTGTLCFESKDGVRRAVLREGDLVTCASGVDDESLMAYLVARGDLPRERMSQLAGRFAAFGRHAGAALVAQGYLRQDQLWPVLRGHAEWILGRALLIKDGAALIEPEPPGRLRGEPSVFGGSTGAEVLVEVLRRVIPPDDAARRMGGMRSRVADGPHPALLTECALGKAELSILEQSRGRTLEESLEGEIDTDMASVMFALSLLGVITVLPSVEDRRDDASPAAPQVDALDAEAIRARVRARLDLIHEGDYFAILGIPRTATGYEVRRAFLELRRAFEPARLLTPQLADLGADVRKIVAVLEEAYEILRDGARRERYRRAIDATPQA